MYSVVLDNVLGYFYETAYSIYIFSRNTIQNQGMFYKGYGKTAVSSTVSDVPGSQEWDTAVSFICGSRKNFCARTTPPLDSKLNTIMYYILY